MPNCFFASTTPESANRILACIQSNTPFFPVSPKELSLPTIALPSSGIVIKTSGSSGKPKYAHLSLDNFCYNANHIALEPHDHYLLSLPLYHVSGLSILFRTTQFVYPDQANLATHASFVPTQLKRFLQNPSPYPKLKTILLGGAPIPYALCKEAFDLGYTLYLTYGMTEMASQICTQKFHPSTGVSFGPPLPHREMKIENGEIFVRGKTLFHGYLNAPSPFIDDWFPTKDLGRIGPHGLEILGRKDRMLISGGENIHPEEIEQALLSHPQIFSAKVRADPDPEFGERPHALVATLLGERQIRDHLESLIPRYKIPDTITVTAPNIPLTPKG